MTKLFLALFLALLIPACGGGSDSSFQGSGGLSNPDTITLDVANADAVPYKLSVWEYANGAPLTQVLVCWPIPGKGTDPFSRQVGTVTFHADSAIYTHFITLYTSTGTLIEMDPFVKGPGQLFVAVTIQFGKMDIVTNQF